MDERPAIVRAPRPWAVALWGRLREPFPDPTHHAGLHHRLNPRDGERVLQVVPKHLAVYWPLPVAVTVFLVATLTMLARWPSGPAQVFWYLSIAGIAAAVVRSFVEWRDVFVVTNWRVVRLSGVLTVRVATMPINRILDMTLTRTPLGRLLGYGHFVFESAAQEQGLREIRFVPDILAVDREINNAVNQEARRREQLERQARRSWTTHETTDPLEGL